MVSELVTNVLGAARGPGRCLTREGSTERQTDSTDRAVKCQPTGGPAARSTRSGRRSLRRPTVAACGISGDRGHPPGGRRRDPRRARLQPRQGLLPGAGRDQEGPGRLLRGGGRAPDGGDGGSAHHAAALPRRRRRQVVLPEAGAEEPPGLAADHGRLHPQRHHQRRPGGGRRRPRGVGGEPRVPRLPPVALPGRLPRGGRRDAHRPRPRARDHLRPGAARPPRRSAPSSTRWTSPAT